MGRMNKDFFRLAWRGRIPVFCGPTDGTDFPNEAAQGGLA